MVLWSLLFFWCMKYLSLCSSGMGQLTNCWASIFRCQWHWVCRRAWWRNLCCVLCFVEGKTEAPGRDGGVGHPLPCAVLQPWQDLQWLKLLLPVKCVSDEVFNVVFPRLCQGKGWGWREEGFCCRWALTAGFLAAVCIAPLQQVHGWTDISINPVLLEYTCKSEFWLFLVISETVDVSNPSRAKTWFTKLAFIEGNKNLHSKREVRMRVERCAEPSALSGLLVPGLGAAF